MSENKSNADQAQFNDSQFKFYIAHGVFDLFGKIISLTLKLGIGYFIFLSIDKLADKNTNIDANILFSLFISKENDWGLPWIFAICCLIWAAGERKFRHYKTEKMQKRIIELEQQKDPQRTSSGLTPTGETHPRDK